MQIDHINHIRDDNRISNLRISTNQQNQQNSTSKPGSSSKYKGVHFFKRNKKWGAFVKFNEQKYLGLFDNEEDAARAYNEYATYLNETFDCRYCLNDI